ncbi:MAG: c-type cytochrome [Pararhizobium sp.]
MSTARAPRSLAIGAAVAALALLCGSVAAPAQVGEFAQQQRGRYLVNAGDCFACHTAENGKPFAGGRPIETPFGTIYSPNITPDPETGIGAWTSDQFYRAMHQGIAADGTHLYPAFPYPWFTKVTREDVDAIRAYLRTVPAVKYRRPDNTLPWPLSYPFTMIGWNTLFFDAGTFKPDAEKSADWNRGAYLVQGLGHCGACHNPKNILGATDKSSGFTGGELQHWFAPDLSSDERDGLGSWSKDDIVAFLKTGHNAHTVAYGPMGQVIEDSTSKLNDSDLKAIATYLKALPAHSGDDKADKPDQKVADAGKAIYADMCSACHQVGGEGVKGMFPALKGSAIAQSKSPLTVVRLILNGGHAAWTKQDPNPVSMPSFGWKLSDAEVAAVATYVRSAWGNSAAPVSEGDVHDLRQAVQAVTSAN